MSPHQLTSRHLGWRSAELSTRPVEIVQAARLPRWLFLILEQLRDAVRRMLVNCIGSFRSTSQPLQAVFQFTDESSNIVADAGLLRSSLAEFPALEIQNDGLQAELL